MAAPRPLRQFRGHKADVLDVAWSKSHQFLLSASMDRCVRLWHISRDDCLRVFRCVALPRAQSGAAQALGFLAEQECSMQPIWSCLCVCAAWLALGSRIAAVGAPSS